MKYALHFIGQAFNGAVMEQKTNKILDSGLRRNDEKYEFSRYSAA
jgi:hypothetical protein